MDTGPYVKDKKRYNDLIAKMYEENENVTLDPEYGSFVKENMLQFLIRLARYKFVARMLHVQDTVLEIGCGTGLGTIFLSQHCKSIKGMEVKEHEIREARTINRRRNAEFETIDFFDYCPDIKYDAVVALDVIEHMPEDTARKLIKKTTRHLRDTGMFVLGTPSCYSYEYQGRLSKAQHVKLYDQQELLDLVERYYGRAIAFSMNDEVVHTGSSKMAWYYFVLAFIPKAKK